MRLWYAEKASLGRAIARALGGGKSQNQHILLPNGDVVCWARGHLLEVVDAIRRWSKESLPICPQPFELEIRHPRGKPVQGDIKALIAIGQRFCRKASEIVHAGDAGREGQLLIDELLHYFGVVGKKPILRLWARSLDTASLQKAFACMKPNSEYLHLYEAADVRRKMDWLTGINISRALTLILQELEAPPPSEGKGTFKPRQLWIVGRVQTPTLAYIVQCYRAHESFVSREYFELVGQFKHAHGQFSLRWKPGEDVQVDEGGHVLDVKIVEAVGQRVNGQAGTLLESSVRTVAVKPPLGYSLGELQKAAGKRRLEADRVLAIAQKLYEAGLVSYPRSDCRYLPVAQFTEASSMVSELAAYLSVDASAQNSVLGRKQRSPIWNDSRVGEHHAIRPVSVPRTPLDGDEGTIYRLIALRQLEQFAENGKDIVSTAAVEVAGEHFAGGTRSVLEPGWRALEKSGQAPSKTDDAAQHVPDMSKGDPVDCTATEIQKKKTQRPELLTSAKLMTDMERAWLWLHDPKLKASLKDSGGIGTVATRTAVLTTLERHGYVQRKKGKIYPTPAGIRLVEEVAPTVYTQADMTALQEQALSHVAEGRLDSEKLLDSHMQNVCENVRSILARTSA